jgi:hypothetical protein
MYSGVSLDSFQKKLTVQARHLATHCRYFHCHEVCMHEKLGSGHPANVDSETKL